MYRHCALALLFLVGTALFAVPGQAQAQATATAVDFSREDRTPDFKPLFIHHSCGLFWLHSNNGGLRDALQDPARTNFPIEVHDAWGVDTIADETEVCKWLPKFETMLDLIFTFDDSVDVYYTHPGDCTRIILVKSCYSASDIDSEVTPPGDHYSSKKTIWNYKAAYLACSQIFREHPDALRLAVTAPPRHQGELRVNGLPYYTQQNGLNCWAFNDWFTGEFVENYRKETGLNNLAVFNWFEVLANPVSDPVAPGALKDIYCQDPVTNQSHPNQAGNLAGTAAFIPFFNDVMAAWRTVEADRFELSAAVPEPVRFVLEAGAAQAGRPYTLLGSMSGVEPGFDVQGLHIPLNRDGFLEQSFSYANNKWFVDFQGTLNGSGKAWPSFCAQAPIPPGLVGNVVRFAYVLGPPADYVSGVWPVTIVP